MDILPFLIEGRWGWRVQRIYIIPFLSRSRMCFNLFLNQLSTLTFYNHHGRISVWSHYVSGWIVLSSKHLMNIQNLIIHEYENYIQILVCRICTNCYQVSSSMLTYFVQGYSPFLAPNIQVVLLFDLN